MSSQPPWRTRLIFILLALGIGGVAVVLFSKHPPKPPAKPERLTVCAALFPLYDWAKNVAGHDADVQLLEGEGGDPHHFEPNLQDAQALTHARVLLVVGLGLEPWSHRAMSSNNSLEMLEVGTWVERRKLGEKEREAEELEHGHAHAPDEHEDLSEDPHVWLDPVRAAQIVMRLGEEFARLDPAHATGYRERAAAYASELQAFSQELVLKTKPIAGKKLVTLHDAYGYLLERCGVQWAGAVQTSPVAEPSVREVTEALHTLREIGQKVIFYEARHEAIAQVLAKELDGNMVLLDPLESATSPTNGQTYLERMRNNVQTLVEHLK